MIDRKSPVLLTGTTGMVGGEVLKLFHSEEFENILAPTRAELNLSDSGSVNRYFGKHRPNYVLMLAAKVGGIAANMADPVGFTDENLRIILNLYDACHRYKTCKNLFLGSSCIYPKGLQELITEDRLMTAPLEPTNEGYALSKIIGLKLAKYYFDQYGMLTVCPMLSNVYGSGDHFDLERAHVLSALVRRFVDARDKGDKVITLWGTGIARREFLHSEDAARAVLYFMDHVDVPDHINVGAGKDVSIKELADMISMGAGYRGEIDWDHTKPDGVFRKCLDITKLNELSFQLKVGFLEGIQRTIGEYEMIKECGSQNS